MCKLCFKQQVRKVFAKGKTMTCIRCETPIPDYEIKEVMGAQDFEEIQSAMLMDFVRADSSTISCTCGALLTIEEGRVDYGQKDDRGVQLSRAAAENMSKFRIRCRNCARVFCTSCEADPYHLGKTCEEHKQFRESRKCRFCATLINKPPARYAKPAFMDVCEEAACVDLMDQSCDKVLPCGHCCGGFRGEQKCLPCLHEDCVEKAPEQTLSETADSYCVICYVSALGEQPCVQLSCKHIFHVECLVRRLEQRFAGPRITFLFATCASCKTRVDAPHH